MIDIEFTLGIIIIAIAVITLVRIIKPLLEGLIIIVVIIIGSALVFHSTPLVSLPNFNIPISAGPNVFSANQGVGNTTDLVVFNAYTFNIDSFSATINGKPVSVVNGNLMLQPLKFGVVVLNSTQKGNIQLTGKTNVFGFDLNSLTASYNYT